MMFFGSTGPARRQQPDHSEAFSSEAAGGVPAAPGHRSIVAPDYQDPSRLPGSLLRLELLCRTERTALSTLPPAFAQQSRI